MSSLKNNFEENFNTSSSEFEGYQTPDMLDDSMNYTQNL